jgi:L-rhamnose isomerase
MSTAKHIERYCQLARDRYAALGVESGHALDTLARIPISIHCWQGDDVGGFETADGKC